MKLILRETASLRGCSLCWAHSSPRFSECSIWNPETNPRYAAIRATFPEAQNCGECKALWFAQQHEIPTTRLSAYYWVPVTEHSTLEEE